MMKPSRLELGNHPDRDCWFNRYHQKEKEVAKKKTTKKRVTKKKTTTRARKKVKPGQGRTTKTTKKKASTTKRTTKASTKDAKKLSMLAAAHQVLSKSSTAMTCGELIEAMAKQKLWTSPSGKTPEATLSAAINRNINGDEPKFKRVERGKYEAK
jgi:cytoskeletal protein RodZ